MLAESLAEFCGAYRTRFNRLVGIVLLVAEFSHGETRPRTERMKGFSTQAGLYVDEHLAKIEYDMLSIARPFGDLVSTKSANGR
jgi:hypothetical protein